MSIVAAAADGVSLRELLPDAEFRGSKDILAFGCTTQPHKVQPGDIFVALSDAANRACDLLTLAIQRGCSAVVLEPPARDLPVPQCVVSDAREAFGRICHALAGNPSQHLKLIGVAGANGKTTTCWLIAGILSAAGYKTGLLGSLGYFDGLSTVAAEDCTPPADQLAGLLGRMVQNGCTYAVMEASDSALAKSYIAGAQFDTVCITNFAGEHGQDHAADDLRFTTQRATQRFFRYLAPEGLAVVNADDPVAADLLRHFDGPALTIAIKAPAEISAVLLEQCASEQTFLLMAGNEAAPVRTQMIGMHHVYNCLTAAAVGLAYGIDLVTVARGLESVRQVPGRLERIECGQPFTVFVDCASTPDAFRTVLNTLRGVVQGRLICLFGTAGEEDRHLRPLLGRTVSELADMLVLTTSDPADDNPHVGIEETLLGVHQRCPAVVIVDRRAAIHWALAQARPGDCVLLAGSAHVGYRLGSEQIAVADDRAIARHWLYTVQPYCTLGGSYWC